MRIYHPRGSQTARALRVAATVALVLAAAACEGGGVRDPDFEMMDSTTSATLSSLQSTVFSQRCAFVGCHAGDFPAEGLDLSEGAALDHIVGVPSSEQPAFLRVKPGDAADSYLFMKLVDDPRIDGERMPLGDVPLDVTQLDAIMTWIENGAPNN